MELSTVSLSVSVLESVLESVLVSVVVSVSVLVSVVVSVSVLVSVSDSELPFVSVSVSVVLSDSVGVASVSDVLGSSFASQDARKVNAPNIIAIAKRRAIRFFILIPPLEKIVCRYNIIISKPSQ